MNSLETISLDDGKEITIHYDQDCKSPNHDDSGVKIVILHRRYSDPANGSCGKDSESVDEWCAENSAEWFIQPLFMYDHSGVALSSSPFSCPWDSGQVGIIALKRSEWAPEATEEQLSNWAASVASEYGQWMNGECYGYILRDSEGNEIDSCWGFIGFEYAKECALQSAQDNT